MAVTRFSTFLILTWAFFGCVQTPLKVERGVATSEPFAKPKVGSLFSSYEPLKIHISAPLTTLFKAKTLGRSQFKKMQVRGTLTYNEVKLPIKIKLKGYSTAVMCPFPKMEITILEKSSLFLEEKTFDLNTHCDEKDSGLDSAFRASYFNHREALIYRILDVLEIPSYRARPALVHYKDEDPESHIKEQNTYQAFFLEDMSALKKRLDAREIKGSDDPEKEEILAKDQNDPPGFLFTNIQDAQLIDPEDAARIALFQEMIGNYDWFIKADRDHLRSAKDLRNLWNTKILELPDSRWVLFPQDFSLAALVTGIEKPTHFERVFYSVSLSQQMKIKEGFLKKEFEILQLGNSLDPDGKQYFYGKIRKFFLNLRKI